MSTEQRRAIHSYAGPLVAAIVFLVGFAWQLRAYATLPERVEKVEKWEDQHQGEVVVIRLDLERRLSRIEEKLDRILNAPSKPLGWSEPGTPQYAPFVWQDANQDGLPDLEGYIVYNSAVDSVSNTRYKTP